MSAKARPLRSIASLANYVNGFPFKPDDLLADASLGLPVIRIKQLFDDEIEPDYTTLSVPPKYLLRDGDLVFSWSGSLGVAVWNRGPALLNQHLFRVEPAAGIDRDWLKYAIDSSIVEFESHMRGSAGMSHITSPLMKAVGVPCPGLEDQRRIADFLDGQVARIDAALTIRERQIQVARTLRHSVATVTTRGLDDCVATRDSGAAWLGRIPQHWRLGRLGGIYRRRKDVGHPEEMMLSVFRDFGVVPKESRNNLNVTADDRNIYQLVDEGWLVVNRMKAWQGSVGVSAHRGIVSGHYICFEPRHFESHGYLNWLLRSPAYITAFASLSRGVRPGQAEIDNDWLLQTPVPLPPLDEQKAIEAWLGDADERGERAALTLQRSADLLIEYKRSLITAAVTGEFDVTTASGRGIPA